MFSDVVKLLLSLDFIGILYELLYIHLTSFFIEYFNHKRVTIISYKSSTMIYTIRKETKSFKWTALSAILPFALGFIVTFLLAQIWRLFI